MMKKKVFFSIILIAAVGFCMTASAQNDSTKQTRWQRINQKLKENYAKVNYDTEYIGRPDLLWTVKLKGNIGGSQFNNYGKYAGESMRGKLKSDDMRTIGVEVGYSGLSLGFSINPTSNSKKYKDEEFTMNYYDNHFGFDVEYQHIKSFHGYQNSLGERWPVEKGDMKMNNLRINGYYVFNGKRFSLPAVFNSTWVQRRSAGSFFVQANFNTGRIKIGDNLDSEHSFASSLNRIDMNAFSLGAGYGYNLVAGKHWLLHATVQPSFMVWNNYKLHTTNSEGQEEVNKMATDRINFFVVGRIGAIYSWNKYFLGLTSVVQHSKCGKDNDFAMRDTQWQARAFFGWRIHTKLHERPKPKPNRRRSVRRSTTTTRTAATKTTTKPATTTKKTTTTQKKTTTQPAKKGWTPKLDFSIPKSN